MKKVFDVCIFFLEFITRFLIYIIPTLLIVVFSTTIIYIVYIPKTIALTYYTIIKSPRIDINIKHLLCCVSFIPIFLAPIIIFIATSLCTPFWVLWCAARDVEKSRDNQQDKFPTIFRSAVNIVHDLINAITKSYYSYLRENLTLNADNTILSIRILDIFKGLFVYVFSYIFTTTIILSICYLEIFLINIMSYVCAITNIKAFRKEPLLILQLFVISFIIPLIVLLFTPLYIMCNLYGCTNYVDKLFTSQSIMTCFKYICKSTYETHQFVSLLLFCQFSVGVPIDLLKCLNFDSEQEMYVNEAEHIRGTIQNEINNLRESQIINTFPNNIGHTSNQLDEPLIAQENNKLSITEIWDCVFDACTKQCNNAYKKKYCSLEDLESYDDSLFIKIPNLVIFNVVARSYDCANGVELIDGKIVTTKNIPLNDFFTSTFIEIMCIKQLYIDIRFTEEEFNIVEKWLCVNNEIDNLFENKEKLNKIKNMRTKIQNISINISRMPTFYRRFGDCIDDVIRNVRLFV